MRFSIFTLGLAATAQGAAILPRDSGCTVTLQPTRSPPAGPGEIIALGSIKRWSQATGGGSAYSNWVDYSGSLTAPYSFKYKANTIPGYETSSQIKAVLNNGWVGTYLSGGATPTFSDFLITGFSCS
ncbi:hypothetical protein GGS24DRAFT_483322 [Hypoxylon argillaceum]|nr:hypothetical protein GGS24DRAFT_483322 [Hypoxylon argillaceum]KAI1148002.1 hypothetical protein F4825DRAFT_435569 [Nemania diffusa]